MRFKPEAPLPGSYLGVCIMIWRLDRVEFALIEYCFCLIGSIPLQDCWVEFLSNREVKISLRQRVRERQ